MIGTSKDPLLSSQEVLVATSCNLAICPRASAHALTLKSAAILE